MQLGMVGLGRMGANLVRRLMRDGHECVVYDVNPDAAEALAAEGATAAGSLEELASRLAAPRAVWVMVPAGEITEATVRDVAERLDPGDAIIDGGNTYYRDDIRRAAELESDGISYVDVGTSGGVFVTELDGVILDTARAFAEDLPPVKELFTDLGEEDDFIEDLVEETEAFAQAINSQDTANRRRIGSAAEIDDVLGEILPAVQRLKVMMPKLLKDNPDKLAQWLAASHLERPPKRKKDNQPTP